jgi:hypothetical protein
MSHSSEFIGGVYAWVATAPQPVLTITGHTAVISDVRFVWSRARCGWCRKTVHLYTDGGTVEAGITVGRTRPRSAAVTARWYSVYRPAAAPSIPDDCPNPACHRPATRTLSTGEVVATGWLDGAWMLSSNGPFTIATVTDVRCPLPASPDTYQLLDRVWAALRAAHPALAAAADAHRRDQRRRAERG